MAGIKLQGMVAVRYAVLINRIRKLMVFDSKLT